ncbi:MAG: hypothetical protein BWZ10_00983 [candidate division BRC1 bacterium ADurb.BinA364]|nr:MAG: hypothetical protein BWZ10_00983 [candidate division BRC1 bacterium ADurb.BinA364]
MISNGYIQEQPIRDLAPRLDAIKIDLKSFTESFYRDYCRGELKPVLQTLEIVKGLGLWLEIVVLIIPTLNDGEVECRDLCRWVKRNLGPETPVHFTRFHPMYKLQNLPSTPVETLDRNFSIARSEGLYYPYVGNVPGHPGESTKCRSCGETAIERYGYAVRSAMKDGACARCGEAIHGVWK